MNNIAEFINLITGGATGVDLVYLGFAGGVIFSVTVIVSATTLHVYNNSKGE